jgi:DNA-directed RNA polymerase subunit RPC12/RpoP
VSKRTPSEIRQCAKCGRDYHAGAQKAKRCPVCGGEIKPKEPKMNVLERIPTWLSWGFLGRMARKTLNEIRSPSRKLTGGEKV